MDLKRLNDADKLGLCKRYFIGGFFALPLLWLVNACWFFKQAFVRDSFPEQVKIRMYVACSIVGFFAYSIPFVTWAICFQRYRISWGGWTNDITYMIAAGVP